jgi:hypothetical protein
LHSLFFLATLQPAPPGVLGLFFEKLKMTLAINYWHEFIRQQAWASGALSLEIANQCVSVQSVFISGKVFTDVADL